MRPGFALLVRKFLTKTAGVSGNSLHKSRESGRAVGGEGEKEALPKKLHSSYLSPQFEISRMLRPGICRTVAILMLAVPAVASCSNK